MMMGSILPFVVAAVALIGSPGPNTLSLAGVGASFGRKRGFKYMIGLSLGVMVVVALVGTGVSSLILAIPGVAPTVGLLAAAYFVFLAFKIATAPPLQAPTSRAVAQPPHWLEGFTLSLLNPKAYAAMAALYSGYILSRSGPLVDGLFKAILIAATIVVVNTLWLTVGAALTATLRDPKASRLVNITFAIGLLISVIFAMTTFNQP